MKIFLFLIFTTLLFSEEKIFSPMDFVYVKTVKFEKENQNINSISYQRYLQYFTDSKVSGDKSAIQKLFSSEDIYLNYYESLIKGFNDYYLNGNNLKDKQKSMYRILKAYDRANEYLKDSFEGIFVADILMQEKLFKEADILITSISFCDIQLSSVDRLACKSSKIALNCILNKDYISDLSLLFIENSEVAEYSYFYCIKNK